MAEETEEAGRDVRLLQSITLRNILSFGPDTPELELRALNVLIGPNGSGKSNLLAGLSLLSAIPGEFVKAFQADGNRLRDWFWQHEFAQWATLAVAVAGEATGPARVAQELRFRAGPHHSVQVGSERIWGEAAGTQRLVYEAQRRGERLEVQFQGQDRPGFGASDYNSVVAQLRDPTTYPELYRLTAVYRDLFFFRNWSFGSDSPIRQPRPVSAMADFLIEGGANLTLVLHELRGDPAWKQRFMEALRELYEGADDYETVEQADYVGLFLREGRQRIPAARLSDGTLRFLSLLVILLHPTPPPLLCIEEPELGLHPDAVLAIGRLIKEASERTQLIITTHSDILVDVLGQQPEDIIVCEKHEGQTQLTRLQEPELRGWLERYTLSQLWTKGKLGGTRW